MPDLNDKQYDLACVITGRRDNLRMYSFHNPAGELVGWVWVNIDFVDELAHLKISVDYKRDETKPIDI